MTEAIQAPPENEAGKKRKKINSNFTDEPCIESLHDWRAETFLTAAVPCAACAYGYSLPVSPFGKDTQK